MTLTKTIPSQVFEVRCFNIVTNEKRHRYGELCNRFIAARNTEGEIAGKFHCTRCGANYEVINNKLMLLGE